MQSYQLDRALDASGNPLSGAKAKFYQSGGLTPAAVFSDAGLTASLGATLTSDSAGNFLPQLVYLDPTKTYRCIATTSAGVTLPGRDNDPINTPQSGGGIDGADINDDSIPGGALAPGAIPDALGYTPADEVDLNVVQAVTVALTGMIAPFGMTTPPTGWLECDGSSVLRADYPALFAAIGTTWGSADGTHFNVPDLRGEFLRGWDHGKNTDTGRAFASSQADEIKAHTHTLPNNQTNMNSTGGTTTGGFTGTGTATGSTGGAETRPRNIAVIYCIKA